MSKIHIPTFLERGDTVAIIAPSGFIDKTYIENAKIVLESWGLKVVVGNNCLNTFSIYAGTDQERLSDLQNVVNDNSIKAIFCARGGYGLIRIIDELDLTLFLKRPKWIVGFSDITILHAKLLNYNIASIHGPMPKTFINSDQLSLDSLKEILFRNKPTYIETANKLNKVGECIAPIVGGNLSILYSLLGTPLQISTENKILFIEDLCELYYHLDRMMWSLKKAGCLANLKGLIVGGFTDMRNGAAIFNQSSEEIIRDAVNEYDYPVCFNFPISHSKENRPIVQGSIYKLSVTSTNVELTMHSEL